MIAPPTMTPTSVGEETREFMKDLMTLDQSEAAPKPRMSEKGTSLDNFMKDRWQLYDVTRFRVDFTKEARKLAGPKSTASSSTASKASPPTISKDKSAKATPKKK
mmetsp:Transcript_40237/g.61410  ORF Transcript_40237/g.61410 Transcript_40237/m.61410 type:complete len:105 (-) Transcript_40237:5131-5445(-)